MDIVRRKLMLVTIGTYRVKASLYFFFIRKVRSFVFIERGFKSLFPDHEMIKLLTFDNLLPSL